MSVYYWRKYSKEEGFEFNFHCYLWMFSQTSASPVSKQLAFPGAVISMMFIWDTKGFFPIAEWSVGWVKETHLGNLGPLWNPSASALTSEIPVCLGTGKRWAGKTALTLCEIFFYLYIWIQVGYGSQNYSNSNWVMPEYRAFKMYQCSWLMEKHFKLIGSGWGWVVYFLHFGC